MRILFARIFLAGIGFWRVVGVAVLHAICGSSLVWNVVLAICGLLGCSRPVAIVGDHWLLGVARDLRVLVFLIFSFVRCLRGIGCVPYVPQRLVCVGDEGERSVLIFLDLGVQLAQKLFEHGGDTEIGGSVDG